MDNLKWFQCLLEGRETEGGGSVCGCSELFMVVSVYIYCLLHCFAVFFLVMVVTK